MASGEPVQIFVGKILVFKRRDGRSEGRFR